MLPAELTRPFFLSIHYHGPVNKIEGNQGCAIATNESRISSSTAKYESESKKRWLRDISFGITGSLIATGIWALAKYTISSDSRGQALPTEH